MKVKLIFPFISTMRFEGQILGLPYGIGVLSARLKKNNIDVTAEDAIVKLMSRYSMLQSKRITEEILNFHKRQVTAGKYVGIADRRNNCLADQLLKYVNIDGFDVVGMSVLSSSQMLPALLLSEKIKKEFNKTIVWGGPHVTSFAHLFFKQYDFIDYAIVGDGEEPLVKLIRYLEKKEGALEAMPSLWSRGNGDVLSTPRKYYDIEEQACPDFDDLPLELYKQYIKPNIQNLYIPYSTSRGCGNQCSYCMYPSIDGPWQSKSVGKVIREIDFLKNRYKSNFFIFEDGSINTSKKFIDQLCDTLVRNKSDIVWSARVNGNTIDEEVITKMKAAGCEMLSWGIESASKKVLKLMHRNPNIEYQEKMLRYAKTHGMKNLVYLIITYPFSTAADYESNILFIKNNAHAIDWLKTYDLSIYNGSYLFNNAEKLNVNIQPENHSFFTFRYSFKEADDGALNTSKILGRLYLKIINTGYKHVFSRRVRFPFNILAGLLVEHFGITFEEFYTVLEYRLRINKRLLARFVFRPPS